MLVAGSWYSKRGPPVVTWQGRELRAALTAGGRRGPVVGHEERGGAQLCPLLPLRRRDLRRGHHLGMWGVRMRLYVLETLMFTGRPF